MTDSATKLSVDDIKIGAIVEATFFPNPKAEASGFRWRATHLDGRRAPKVVLCDDPRIRAGIPALVKVASLEKPERDDAGKITVEFVKAQEFKLEGVWLDPIASKKLQVMLESGLNILLDGPQGCGKTVLAKAIAASLGYEFVYFNCGAVVEATDFLATLQVRADAGGRPVTDFVKTEVLLAIEAANAGPHRRALVFLDELNRCPESARNALMPALDTTRRIFNPVENRFIPIPDGVQFVAAVNRGGEFSGTFGIDAAQLDRFAPLQLDYLPPPEEIKLLRGRHPEVPAGIVEKIVTIADRVRRAPELSAGLSVRATDEACTYLKHPLMEADQSRFLPEVLRSSFCGRFGGKWSDPTSDAGAVWALVEVGLKEKG